LGTTELQTLQAEYDEKKTAFENEKVLLVGEQLKLKRNRSKKSRKKIKKFIAEKFSGEGEINKFRANLAKPFQDQIWNAIKTVTEKNTLGIVLDKSNNISVIFLDKRYDYTDKVLDQLLKTPSKEDTKSKDAKAKNKK
jgi:outer membrane protein